MCYTFSSEQDLKKSTYLCIIHHLVKKSPVIYIGDWEAEGCYLLAIIDGNTI